MSARPIILDDVFPAAEDDAIAAGVFEPIDDDVPPRPDAEVEEIARSVGRDTPADNGAAAQPQPPASIDAATRLRVALLDDFVSVEEQSAVALVGTPDETVVPAGGDVNMYGDGGVGKTTLELDAVVHLAAGAAWLGFDVARPLRIVVIENEGPRGPFRRKVERRANAWGGPPFRDNLHFLEEPWGAFTFSDPGLRAELAEYVTGHEIDIVAGGPMSRLGTIGGGTPAEVVEFEGFLAAFRSLVPRPVAFWLIHHENKAGEVSGAWDRAFDTILHLKPDGKGRSRLRWRKARWAESLHGRTWTLSAVDQTFTVIDRGDTPAADERAAADTEALEWITEWITAEHARTTAGVARGHAETAYVDAHPGKGSRARARRVIDRQLLLAAEHLHGDTHGEDSPLLAKTNGERANGIYLIPYKNQPSPLAASTDGEYGEDGTPAPSEPAARQLAAAYERSGERRADSEGPLTEELEWR